jgi:phosphatidylserine/phosphatidylglycerophosphate/cardiolipin synthase-like enzyme
MQKMIRIALLTLFLASLLQGRAWYMMPDDGVRAEEAAVHAIADADEEIILALYSFTNNSLTRALKKAAARGVAITLLVDESQVHRNSRHHKAGELAKLQNVTVHVTKGRASRRRNYHGLMHLKLCIIDRHTIIHGSANWSHNAFNLSHELLIIEEDPKWADQLLRRLEPTIKAAQPYTQ